MIEIYTWYVVLIVHLCIDEGCYLVCYIDGLGAHTEQGAQAG